MKKIMQGIKHLIRVRNTILRQREDDPAINGLTNDILIQLHKHFDNLEVDFIIESLTHLGHAPNVIYDDNGMFAITGNGYQPVVTGKERAEGAFTNFVEKKQWAKTIRAALIIYMKDCKPKASERN